MAKHRQSIRPEAPMRQDCRLVAVGARKAGRRDYITRRVSKRTGYAKPVCDEIIKAVLVEIMQVVCELGYVEIKGFGRWGVYRYAGGRGRSYQSGKLHTIPPGYRVRFRLAGEWRKVVREYYNGDGNA